MVHSLQCCSAQTPLRPLFFSIIILLLTSSMDVAHSDARRLPLRLQEIGIRKGQEAAGIRGGETTMDARRRALIGSRPPRCERVCMSCGYCEAVQVPIVPLDDHHRLQKKATAGATTDAAAVSAALFTYRVDGITNYKPLSWKCRCGSTIVDP